MPAAVLERVSKLFAGRRRDEAEATEAAELRLELILDTLSRGRSVPDRDMDLLHQAGYSAPDVEAESARRVKRRELSAIARDLKAREQACERLDASLHSINGEIQLAYKKIADRITQLQEQFREALSAHAQADSARTMLLRDIPKHIQRKIDAAVAARSKLGPEEANLRHELNGEAGDTAMCKHQQLCRLLQQERDNFKKTEGRWDPERKDRMRQLVGKERYWRQQDNQFQEKRKRLEFVRAEMARLSRQIEAAEAEALIAD